MCAKLNPFFSPSTKKSSCGGYPRREEVQESAVPLAAGLSITEHADRRRQTDGRSAVCVWRQLATNHLSVHQLCNISFCMFRKKNTCHVLGPCRVHLQHVDACAATISYIILYMTDLLLVLKELPRPSSSLTVYESLAGQTPVWGHLLTFSAHMRREINHESGFTLAQLRF